MSFVCTLDGAFAPPLIQQDGSSRVVIIPIGYQQHEDKSYFLTVTLDTLPPGDIHEFAFSIVEYDGETNSEYVYWNSGDLRHVIPSDDRKIILDCLKAVTAYLLEKIRPAQVMMCTVEAGLPPQAVRKFFAVAHTFEACGYKVGKYDDYHGQHVWKMVLVASE